jgi:predicted Zn-dependent protease
MGESLRALAEEAILLGRNHEAVRIAERAKKQLKLNTSDWLRAEDIITVARQNIKDKENR